MKSAWTGNHPARRGMNRKIRQTLQFYAISAPDRTRYKKLPPYAKTAAARLAAHAHPSHADLRIFTGAKAWDQARFWSDNTPKPILALPPGDNPGAYAWAIVADAEPWVIETGGTPDSCLQHLALALLTAGARVVRMSFWDGSDRQMAVFRRQGESNG